MQDFNLDKDTLLNPSDVVVPKGWTVLSHGTSFQKWNNPMPGIPAQDLKNNTNIIIHNTLNGGLTCFDEQNKQMPAVYAGQEEPVIFRVLVPGDLKSFDLETFGEALRFIKPDGLEPNVSLIPTETVLIKLAEEITDRPGIPSVIWYVPEQFYALLQKALVKLNAQKERKLAEDKDESAVEFDINSSFAAAEEALKEEHILEQEEKADEYYEDLVEQDQALVEEKIAAEEKIAEKRAKDKKRGREQDKKNFAAAEAEHQRQMAETNAARERTDSASSDYSQVDYESPTFEDYETINSEPYSYSGVPNDPPPINEDFSGTYSQQDNALDREIPAPTNIQYEDGYNQNVSGSEGFNHEQAPFVAPTEGTPATDVQDRAGISEYEKRNRQYKDDEYELFKKQQEENAARFQNELQAEAQRRQQQSENYKSFGQSGIDFSGKDNHSVYSDNNSSPQNISAEDLKQYEDVFHSTREKFRSYSGAVPDNVANDYKSARDQYFSVQRQIAAGTLVITPPASSHSDSTQTGMGGGSSSVKTNTSTSHTTAQNTKAGADAPGRREGQSLKDPPKSPVDNTPLTFNAEKFRAVRRFANTVGDSSVRTGRVVKNQLTNVAYSEESGTTSTMTKFTQGVSEMSIVYDCFVGGSGKQEAAKIWSQYVADANGTKTRGIDKQAVKDYGKINLKTVDGKLKEALTDADLKSLHKKFGKEADVGVAAAVGTHNGKLGKAQAFVDGKVNVRIAEGKIGALRNQSTNLKTQIKELQSKGSALTGAERQRLSDLLAKKKATDEKLRNMVGATNSRHKTERLYRQINSMSARKVQKELKKLEDKVKKGLKLNKVQKQQLKALKERNANLKMREKLGGRGRLSRAARLGGIATRHLGKFMRDSDDETFSTMMSMTGRVRSASNFATNRYVKGALKWTTKAALAPARLALRGARVLDRKYGVSKAVSKAVSKPVNAATSKLLHTKPMQKITSSRLHTFVKNNGGLRKSVKPGLGKLVPNRAKLAAKRIREVFQRLNKNPVVRGAKAILSAPFKGLKFLNGALNFVKGLITKYIVVPIALMLLCAFLTSTVAAVIVSIPAGVFSGTEESDDGRIDLTSYVQTLNKEQEKINQQVAGYKNNTEANGGDYKRVYVNYLGGANSNNYREILSMTAVYFEQEFSNEDAVTNYMVNLYNASNYITTEESETYYCSGCEERTYKCTDALDEYATSARKNLYNSNSKRGGCIEYEEFCHDGCKKKYCTDNENHLMSAIGDCDNYNLYLKEKKTYYQCLGHSYCDGHTKYKCDGNHSEKICKGHVDLYVNVACLGFDKLFAADPGTTVGLDLGNYKQGDLIGTFKITYYCAEKYPHICNAGPPYKTASGTTVTAGKTIAVDKSVIPLGTAVVINGHTYIAEDTGGAIKGNRIDIAVNSHQEALTAGTDVFNVYAAEDAGTDAPEEMVQRDVQEYLQLAEQSTNESISAQYILQAFGHAKEPVIYWKYDRVNYDDKNSFAAKLQKYDDEHKNEPFSNAELNVLEYVQMSTDQLKNLCKERGLSDSGSNYTIITERLIPYDKEHPDEYVVEPSKGNNKDYYFAGWNADNKEWAKTILSNMNDETYAGLEEIGAGSGSGSLSLEGVTIQGSKINVTYYSQHDSRWANVAVRNDYPHHTISSSGCGFTSMAIVVSSLTDNTIDPVSMCNKYGKTYYAPGVGAYWSIVPSVSEAYGLKCTEMSIYVQNVINALQDGKLVVVSVGSGGQGYTGNGYYKGAGHFLVICGVTADSKFILADPNNASVSTSGTGVDIQHFLDSGIKTWWAISK